MFTRFPLCLLCKPVSQDRGQRALFTKLLALGTATCGGGGWGGVGMVGWGGEGGGSQVNDIKPCVLILSLRFVALTLA